MPSYLGLPPQLRLNDWESRFFGRPIMRVERPLKVVLPLQFDEAALKGVLLQAKVPSTDVVWRDALEQAGFQHIEQEVQFCFTLSVPSVLSLPPSRIRVADEHDLAELSQLCGQAFRQSRFRPPYFSLAEQQRFYQTWIEHAIDGQFDHLCFIERNDQGQLNGTISLRRVEKGVRIGLLAVDTACQRQGVAHRLLNEAKRWSIEQGADRLWVCTQRSNHAAIACYLAEGAQQCDSQDWFYR